MRHHACAPQWQGDSCQSNLEDWYSTWSVPIMSEANVIDIPSRAGCVLCPKSLLGVETD